MSPLAFRLTVLLIFLIDISFTASDSGLRIPHSAFPSALLFPILDSALRFGLALPLAMHSALLSVFLPPSLFPTIIP